RGTTGIGSRRRRVVRERRVLVEPPSSEAAPPVRVRPRRAVRVAVVLSPDRPVPLRGELALSGACSAPSPSSVAAEVEDASSAASAAGRWPRPLPRLPRRRFRFAGDAGASPPPAGPSPDPSAREAGGSAVPGLAGRDFADDPGFRSPVLVAWPSDGAPPSPAA